MVDSESPEAARNKTRRRKLSTGESAFADYALAKIREKGIHGVDELCLGTEQFEFVDRNYRERFDLAKSAAQCRQVVFEYGERYLPLARS
jgi:hypothetical protein